MKKWFTLLFIILSMTNPTSMLADGYSKLWQRQKEATGKDLPKTRINILQQIADKAAAEGAWGHLLKAELMKSAVQTSISADSLTSELERLQKLADAAPEGSPQEAVWQCALGRIYESIDYDPWGDADFLNESNQQKAKECYAKAMAHPQMLAETQATGYEPALKPGVDSRIFGNDLLHVIGIETNQYKTMHDWYKSHGNPSAACLCALEMIRRSQPDETEVKRSKYIQQLDSLIQEYANQRECGEVAIERYNFMEESEDATAEEKMNYINYALAQWGSWPRMNILRNAQNELTLPSFNVDFGDEVQMPNTPRIVKVRQLVNIQKLTMTIHRLNITGENNYDVNSSDDLQRLKKLISSDEPVQMQSHRFVGQPTWKVLEDTMTIDPLPLGAYLVEFSTNNSNIKSEYALLYVSDLYVIQEALPNHRTRLVAVKASTGEPIPGANIKLTWRNWNGERKSQQTLTCDEKGEAEYKSTDQAPHIYIYTADDRACPESNCSAWFRYYSPKLNGIQATLFTDRRIYRPGQTVKVSLVAYKNTSNVDAEAAKDVKITFQLYDANNKKVAEKSVNTDDYGTAWTEFELPQSGLTGRFSIRSQYGNTWFSVEEYKRPTFRVTFDELKESYAIGDTVSVTGRAETFSGVPVQGAQVAYTIKRKSVFGFRNAGATIATDTITTDAEGLFHVDVPLNLPPSLLREIGNSKFCRFHFDVEARVTDAGGETQSAETFVPISNKATQFEVFMPSRIAAPDTITLTFSRKNSAGKEIAGDVAYTLDNGKTQHAQCNVQLKWPTENITSGKHHIKAVCGNDTIEQEFVVFRLDDKHPAEETHDWYYVSAEEFPADGSPVYVQMGSSDANQHIVYTVLSGDKVLESGSLDQSNSITTRQFVWKEEYGDGITFTCAWVRDGKLYSHRANIRRPMPDKRLNAKWITFRDKLTPGQKETWTLHVDHPDGKAAQAQLMATMYDKSLDEILQHRWAFSLRQQVNLPSTFWHGFSWKNYSLYAEMPYKALAERAMDYTHFDEEMLNIEAPLIIVHEEFSRMHRPMLMAKASMASVNAAIEDGALPEVNEETDGRIAGLSLDRSVEAEEPAQETTTSNSIRENFNETALFYPALQTNDKGDVEISFTLPESITTWRFVGFAHDQQMNNGFVEGEVIAQKTVMLSPNLPRFIRQGDKGAFSARIYNTSEHSAQGNATMELIDPETSKVVFTQKQRFAVESGKSTTATFQFNAKEHTLPALLICKMTADGKGFSDGEQHYLPVLPDKEMMINTVPFTQNEPGTKTIDVDALFPVKDATNKLTVEYTNNPAWLMVQALPSMSHARNDNAIDLTVAYYANAISAHLLNQSPDIKQKIELWQQEKTSETSLMSALQKNQDLKTLVLEETPWVADADNEAEQKQMLKNFFDENSLNFKQNNFLSKLKKLQNADGSFSWWPGMRGSTYMTSFITMTLTRLQQMVGKKDDITSLLNKAHSFMSAQAHEHAKELQKLEKKGEKGLRPSETMVDYLYTLAIDKDRKLNSQQTADVKYLVDLLEKQTTEFTIYGKAVAAVVLAKNGRQQKAAEYLQSISEYSVYKEEMGRYFDTHKAYYSWFDYKIPTQVAAIEAYKALKPNDKQTIEEMQRWLLQEKRTQSWDTPINSANAVYAFLNGETSKLETDPSEYTTLKINGKALDSKDAPSAGMGYVKIAQSGSDMKTFTAEKKSQGTSWGAVYAQFMQKTTEANDASSGISVTREVISAGNALKVGDRVKVRITIKADRDYDFVQVIDKRAACLEPVGQISGYHWGYYCTPRDNATTYYFDCLSKGTHIVETEYYIDRAGEWQTGICTAQCAYSPEYTARTAAKTINVEP